jgi:7-cyano-7-deazaguanine reductase
MAKAEGKMLKFDGPEKIDAGLLECFPYKGEKQYIEYKTREFSAVCPFSGLPDVAKLLIEYVPAKSCIELKSLKYYLVSYRNVGIYQEDATNRLFADIWRVIKPRYMKLTTIYNTRGGIDSRCSIEKGKK